MTSRSRISRAPVHAGEGIDKAALLPEKSPDTLMNGGEIMLPRGVGRIGGDKGLHEGKAPPVARKRLGKIAADPLQVPDLVVRYCLQMLPVEHLRLGGDQSRCEREGLPMTCFGLIEHALYIEGVAEPAKADRKCALPSCRNAVGSKAATCDVHRPSCSLLRHSRIALRSVSEGEFGQHSCLSELQLRIVARTRDKLADHLLRAAEDDADRLGSHALLEPQGLRYVVNERVSALLRHGEIALGGSALDYRLPPVDLGPDSKRSKRRRHSRKPGDPAPLALPLRSFGPAKHLVGVESDQACYHLRNRQPLAVAGLAQVGTEDFCWAIGHGAIRPNLEAQSRRKALAFGVTWLPVGNDGNERAIWMSPFPQPDLLVDIVAAGRRRRAEDH